MSEIKIRQRQISKRGPGWYGIHQKHLAGHHCPESCPYYGLSDETAEKIAASVALAALENVLYDVEAMGEVEPEVLYVETLIQTLADKGA